MNLGKGFTLGLAIVLLIGFFVSVPLLVKADSTTTITVPNDFPTITAAIANASNGDIILVKNGIYNETSGDTNKTLMIVGQGAQSTIINLTPTSHTEVIDVLGHTATFFDNSISINASNFSLSGFTITSNGAISVTGNGAQITNNNFKTSAAINGNSSYVFGNTFLSDTDITVDYSKISSNIFWGASISIQGQYDIISQNTITDSNTGFEATSGFIYNNTLNNSPNAFSVNGNGNVIEKNVIDHLEFGLEVSGQIIPLC